MDDLKQIKKFVEVFTKVNILTNSRNRRVVIARAIFFEAAARKTLHSLAKIGEYVGRDHTTVLHARKQIDGYLNDYPSYIPVFEHVMDLDLKKPHSEVILSKKAESTNKKNAERIMKLQDKIFKLRKEIHGRKKFSARESHAPLVEIVNQIPDHQVELVRTRLEPIVKMLPKN